MANDMDDLHRASVALGKDTLYPSEYDSSLLAPIPRSMSRAQLFTSEALPFIGADIWTGYELSWLNERGVPKVAIAEFVFPCDSPNIIESKSFKYYLNSLNQTRFESNDHVLLLLKTDLSRVAGSDVGVTLFTVDEYHPGVSLGSKNIDDLDIDVEGYSLGSIALQVEDNEWVENEKLHSHLLKSNCPVTGQPDWATIGIEYSGNKIVEELLLEYIVSFRLHQDFHENCVEKIFSDIKQQCKPDQLTVYARYTRRGGLDINPVRSDYESYCNPPRVVRQ